MRNRLFFEADVFGHPRASFDCYELDKKKVWSQTNRPKSFEQNFKCQSEVTGVPWRICLIPLNTSRIVGSRSIILTDLFVCDVISCFFFLLCGLYWLFGKSCLENYLYWIVRYRCWRGFLDVFGFWSRVFHWNIWHQCANSKFSKYSMMPIKRRGLTIWKEAGVKELIFALSKLFHVIRSSPCCLTNC